jgi:hypothetical protein
MPSQRVAGIGVVEDHSHVTASMLTQDKSYFDTVKSLAGIAAAGVTAAQTDVNTAQAHLDDLRKNHASADDIARAESDLAANQLILTGAQGLETDLEGLANKAAARQSADIATHLAELDAAGNQEIAIANHVADLDVQVHGTAAVAIINAQTGLNTALGALDDARAAHANHTTMAQAQNAVDDASRAVTNAQNNSALLLHAEDIYPELARKAQEWKDKRVEIEREITAGILSADDPVVAAALAGARLQENAANHLMNTVVSDAQEAANVQIAYSNQVGAAVDQERLRQAKAADAAAAGGGSISGLQITVPGTYYPGQLVPVQTQTGIQTYVRMQGPDAQAYSTGSIGSLQGSAASPTVTALQDIQSTLQTLAPIANLQLDAANKQIAALQAQLAATNNLANRPLTTDAALAQAAVRGLTQELRLQVGLI